MVKKFQFRPGDILKNGWAGDGNPCSHMMYLRAGTVRQGRYTHKVFKCIGYDGQIVNQMQNDHRLEAVGHMSEFDAFRAALKRLKGMGDGTTTEKPHCRMCINARVVPELTDDNDLSFHGIGDCERDWRLMIQSGGGRPMEIQVEAWLGNQWGLIGTYQPKFCPECGRELDEYRKGGEGR